MIVKEEYHSLVKNPLNKKIHTVYVDPTKDEIRELAKETNVARFISHDNHLYLFHGELLHSDAINHLKLPIYVDKPPIEKAFLGIAKPNANGKLQYTDSNQLKQTDIGKVPKFHPHLGKYFS